MVIRGKHHEPRVVINRDDCFERHHGEKVMHEEGQLAGIQEVGGLHFEELNDHIGDVVENSKAKIDVHQSVYVSWLQEGPFIFIFVLVLFDLSPGVDIKDVNEVEEGSDSLPDLILGVVIPLKEANNEQDNRRNRPGYLIVVP